MPAIDLHSRLAFNNKVNVRDYPCWIVFFAIVIEFPTRSHECPHRVGIHVTWYPQITHCFLKHVSAILQLFHWIFHELSIYTCLSHSLNLSCFA